MTMDNIKFRKEIILQLLLATIIVTLYSFSWHYPIYSGWDDKTYILNNPHLSFSLSNIILYFKQPYYQMYTPLTMLSYMFDYNFWGFNSFGYHLQNIFWHIIATLAIYNCFRLFNIKSWIAFFLCLIFAIHPQRVESVVWLSERKDVLCAAFYFLSIFFFLKSDIRGKKSNYAFSFLFYICALLSKPMAVSLPFILLIYVLYKHKTSKIKEHFLKLFPYFIVLLIFFPLTYHNQAVGGGHPIAQQLYIVFYNIKFYFDTAILPTSLNPMYPIIPINSSMLTTFIFYIAVAFIMIFTWIKNRKLLLYGILPIMACYIIALLPVVGIVPFSFSEQADRWSYIPSAFVWFSIALILTKTLYNKGMRFVSKRLFFFSVLAIYASILAFSNYQYQKIWKSRYTIFSYAADNIPVNTMALKYLGDLGLEQGNYEMALAAANQLEQENKGSLDALFFKAAVAYYSGSDKKSVIKQLLRIKPYYKKIVRKNYDSEFRYLETLDMLIGSYYSTGNTQEAIKYTNEALNYKDLKESKRLKYLKIKKELSLQKK